MRLWAVFLTGLFAGGASCAAVQGGLLAGVVARRSPEAVGTAARGSTKRRPASRAAAGSKRRQPPAPPPRPTLADLRPVGWFLAGKLVSHAALGALLGALGDAVQIGFRTRALLQIGAGIVMVLLALNLWGVRGLSRLAPQPPAVLTRLVRRSARADAAAAPLLVGFSTVLVPCGVTLSVEVLAVTSGSPLAGAAVMVAFVLGTSPLFAVLGFFARRSATALRGRFAKLAGVVVLVMGVLSVNTGLVLGGSPISASSALAALRQPPAGGAAAGAPAAAQADEPVVRDGVQEVRIRALDGGYAPNFQVARAGVPTRLVVETRGTRGCTRAFVIPALGVETTLPEDGDTVLDVGALSPGRLDYTCGMGMYSGAIEVA